MTTRVLQVEPEINYLTKDYNSFRRLMLDRLALLLPGGVDDQPADYQVALLELLAYTADHLSYYQDAVATEAYLGTARRRRSLRRHARLLDYRIHEGCNARVWIRCQVMNMNFPNGIGVDRDWHFLTEGTEPVVFEPCHHVMLFRQHNDITIDTEGEDSYTLLTGVTQARLVQNNPELNLNPGDMLLLEACEQDPGIPLRHVVRLKTVQANTTDVEVTWDAEDALPFDLPVKRKGESLALAVAHGNIVIADHGESHHSELDDPDPAAMTYRPVLPEGPLTRAESLSPDFTDPRRHDLFTSAAGLMRRDIRAALPSITLDGDGDKWTPCHDLLESSGTEASFVVETENNGITHLRFGDGIYGRCPTPGTAFSASYRVGNGRTGNVGSEIICRVERKLGDGWVGIDGVAIINPLPATGGDDPELPEQVRLFAPQAFRRQLRAINADDYAARAQSFPGVQRASADIRWTGSWYTVYLYVDRLGGEEMDDVFKQALLRHMDGYRLAGYDLEVLSKSTYVPLEIELVVEVKTGFVPNAVMAAFLDAFSNRASGGRRGYFHADNWTFGQSVYLSHFYRAALAVPGVAVIDVTKFQRRGDTNRSMSRTNGVVPIGPHEIVSHKNVLNGTVSEDGTLQISARLEA